MSKTLLVDHINLAFRWSPKLALKGLSSSKVAQPFATSYYNTIISFAKSFDCDNIAICTDYKGSKYRKTLYPEYKANRKREDQSEEEKQQFFTFLNYANEALDTCQAKGIEVLKFEGVEADDIIAYLVLQNPNYEFVILSTDSDLDQLISDNVWRFAYTTQKEFRQDNWEEHHAVAQEHFIAAKIIKGDTSDNIPGVKGLGDKRISALIDKYGDPFCWDSSMFDGTSQYINNLKEFLEDGSFERNFDLIDLEHVNDDIIDKQKAKIIQEVAYGFN